MAAVNSKLAQALFPVLTVALLATACSDSTAPSAGDAREESPTSSVPDAPAGAKSAGAKSAGVKSVDGPVPEASAATAPVMQAKGRTIPGQYIIVFKKDVRDAPGLAKQLTKSHGGRLMFTYGAPLPGFAASHLPDQAIAALAKNPNISYIQPDQIVDGDAIIQTMPSGQPWGLDRIDQRTRALSKTYGYGYTGYGVHAYILDSGLDYSHPEFGGRAQVDYDVFGGYSETGTFIGYGTDCHGHGTHVAGTVGARTYGVAKSVRLHGVKVLDCRNSGTMAGAAKGVEWVYYHRINPAVANMSLGGGIDPYLDSWVTALANSGVFVAVAAGNKGVDACNVSPARAAGTFTTAATDWFDSRVRAATWTSNYGRCVDAYAPGDQITSTWPGGRINTIGGTSMASPHVAGVAALLKQGYGNQSWVWIRDKITSWATVGVVGANVSGTPNLLLYKGAF
jgi:subtilisin family serine protease